MCELFLCLHAPMPAISIPPGRCRAPAEPSNDAVPPTRQSIFSKQQLATVAASISRLPCQSVISLPPLQGPNQQRASYEQQRRIEEAETREQQRLRQQEELELDRLQQLQQEGEQARRFRASLEQARLAALQQQQAEEEAAEAERQARQPWQGSRHASQHSSRERTAGAAPQAGQQPELADRASLDADQLSGFTVYTNELEAAEGVNDGEVVQPEPHVERRLRDSHGSGVEWRSISSAALSSRSEQAEDAAMVGPEQAVPRDQQAVRRSHNSLRGSHGRMQQQVHDQACGAEQQQLEPQQGAKLRQHARQLSRLVLPDLDSSQVSQHQGCAFSRDAQKASSVY